MSIHMPGEVPPLTMLVSDSRQYKVGTVIKSSEYCSYIVKRAINKTQLEIVYLTPWNSMKAVWWVLKDHFKRSSK